MKDEELFQSQEALESVEPLEVNETESSKASVPVLNAKLHVPTSVDEQHPVVVKLRSLGYELKECIEASRIHPEDAVDAQNYLIQKKQGDFFNSSLIKRLVVHSKLVINWKPLRISVFKSATQCCI